MANKLQRDIDFTPLLEHGVLEHDEVRAIVGCAPTYEDLAAIVRTFRAKHPDQAPLARAAGGRIYLMTPSEALDYRARRVVATANAHKAALDLLQKD